MRHDSDCAVHNAPAYAIGKCDCSVAKMKAAKEKMMPRLSNSKSKKKAAKSAKRIAKKRPTSKAKVSAR